MRNSERLDGLDLTPEFNCPSGGDQGFIIALSGGDELEAADGDATASFALSEQILIGRQRSHHALCHPPVRHPRITSMWPGNRMLSQHVAKFFLFRRVARSCRETIAGLSPPPVYAQNSKTTWGTDGCHDRQPELVAERWTWVDQRWQEVHSGALCPDLSHASKTKHTRLVLALGERLLRCRYLSQSSSSACQKVTFSVGPLRHLDRHQFWQGRKTVCMA